MNKKLVFSVMLICLLVFVAIFAFGQNSPNVRWEYYRLDNISITEFNRLGAEGWELVVVLAPSISFFKRKLP
jgi:hypothetical protein